MPQMKCFNEIGKIQRWYEDILEKANGRNGDEWLEEFKLNYNDLPIIKENMNACAYLIGCQLGFVRNIDQVKPPKEVLIRAFEQRLKRLNELYPEGIAHMQNTMKYRFKRKFEVSEHYLLKLSDDDWYKKLPDKIFIIKHKYPEVINEDTFQNEQINELDLD